MQSKIKLKIVPINLYLSIIFIYLAFIFLTLLLSFIESFTYSGFFLKHFHISLNFFASASLGIGLLVSIMRPPNQLRRGRWADFLGSLLIFNLGFLLALFSLILAVNILESLNYENFIFSKIHLNPKLIIKVGFIELLSLCVNSVLIVRTEHPLSLKVVRFFKLLSPKRFILKSKTDDINVPSIIPGLTFIIYSIVLLAFTITGSLSSAYKFYEKDKIFLKDNELKYALRDINIYQWIEIFFPKTKDFVNWCDQQVSPVHLVSFDPQILWLNYEGLSRVFLTNCTIENIYSENRSRDYIGRKNIFLVSITPCEKGLVIGKDELSGSTMEYFRKINNYYICRSAQIVQSLYFYESE